ncbi:c-type cytochrome [Pseudaestuariivita rosea]|uniref:c-type cytochrome n=1 Tax=Pseudaestuariivita rosea TaxID=2763263 RepID=UPI001ABB24C7|nr:c-type cytochrome [Pseudaestuariivita rosea]
MFASLWKNTQRHGLRRVAAILFILAAPQMTGAQQDWDRIFQQRCAACHSLETRGRGAGPSLAGALGRATGSLEGARYSQAVPEAGLIWDAATLDRFFVDPRRKVPGTRKNIRLTDTTERAVIIAFLEGV